MINKFEILSKWPMTAQVFFYLHFITVDCKKSELGYEYNGTLSVTISGRKCQKWSIQTPHAHSNTNPEWFPERSITEVSNFCRNPSGWVEGPWCYTIDSKVQWEICDLQFCQGNTTFY